jgi:hypothetical protein
MRKTVQLWTIGAVALGVFGWNAPNLAAQNAASNRMPSVSATTDASEPNTYGTSATSIYNLGPDDFTVLYGAWLSVNTFGNLALRNFGAGPVYVEAPLHLPAGAQVTSVSFYYFDALPANPEAWLLGGGTTGGPGYTYEQAIVFPNTATGNSSVTAVLPTPLTIDNATSHYSVQVGLSQAMYLYRVRVTYRLQVSPAPGTATFTDVPVGNPYHPFVEALVASGVTGGCGGGNYCPDAPVTRAQMAVFLAAALGLHWPN